MEPGARRLRFGGAGVVGGALWWLAAATAVSGQITRLEPLGEVAVPVAAVGGVQVGGLSGLTWDPQAGRYWAISDDRAERGPVRAYRLRIDVERGRLRGAEVDGFLDLKLGDGADFGSGRVDPEGIARLPDGSFLVSSEGVVRWQIPPFLRVFGSDGIERFALPLPPRYVTRRDRQAGVRDNLGFESAATTEDGRWGFTAVESPLIEDGGEPSQLSGGLTRILRFDLARRRLDAEFAYRVDPLQKAPSEARINVSGVVDLLPLSEDRLLVLERAFAMGVGNRVRLYETSLAGAEDVRDVSALAPRAGSLRVAEKELVLDVGALGIVPENLEGLTFGPDLADGRRLLLLLGDDNFAYPLQRSQLLAFAADHRPVEIHDVQGVSHRSPLAGHWVRDVEGVVTAVLGRRGRGLGFWLEAEGARRDDDARSSEGLFVEGSGAVAPTVGDLVRVQGAVEEAGSEPGLTTTRLTGGSVELVRTDVALPPPTRPFDTPLPAVVDDDGFTLFEPATDAADRLESVEGMRVLVPPSRVVGPTTSYGEIAVLAGSAADLAATRAGGILLPPEGALPGPLLLGGRLARSPAVAVGDRLPALAGVVDYGWDKYVIEVLDWPPIAAAPQRETGTALRRDAEHLLVATFNLLNLDPSDPPEKLAGLAECIVDELGSPDVIALQEVQDDSGPVDDGTVSAELTLGRLVAAIEAAGGPAYEWRQLDPEDGREGGEPGGNIRVAFLFDPSRVSFPAETLARLPSLDGGAPGDWPGGRPCLAGTILFGAESLGLVNCHLKSKQGDDPLYGVHVPPRRPTEKRRLAQAEVVARWLEERAGRASVPPTIVLGDLNENGGRAPVERLLAAGLVDLVSSVPAPDRYTFNFQGFSQVLDHILVAPPLAEGAVARVVHVNADRPASESSSDHDPIVARLCLAGECARERPR